jgi:hypothetical protein
VHVSIASLILPLDFKLVNANFCTPTNSVKHAVRTCKDLLHQFSQDQYNERFSSYEMSPKTQLKCPLLLFDFNINWNVPINCSMTSQNKI